MTTACEPLVLLPGMMCDARLFTPQIAAFSAERTLVAPVLRGDETAAHEAATVEIMAARVLAEAPPRFALAGLSMGGIVAMSVIAAAPERVTRLALMDTNPLAEAADVAARRGPQIEAVRRGELARVMRDEMKPRYLADGPRRGDILDLCMMMAEALGPDVFIRQSQALRARPDRRDALRAVRVPTLVLCGRRDALCPVSRHEAMRDLIPGAALTVIEGAGHLPTLERPTETNAALADWLRR